MKQTIGSERKHEYLFSSSPVHVSLFVCVEFTCHFKSVRSILLLFFIFLMENLAGVSKQC